MGVYVDVFMEKRLPGEGWHAVPLYTKNSKGEIKLNGIFYGQSYVAQLVRDLEYKGFVGRMNNDEVSPEVRELNHLDDPETSKFTTCYECSLQGLHKFAERKGDMAGWVTQEDIDEYEKSGSFIGDVIFDDDLLENPEAAKLIQSHRKYYYWTDPEGSLAVAKRLAGVCDAIHEIFFWSDLDMFRDYRDEVSTRLVFVVD